MDQYIVNGVEIDYDTFDLENMESYNEEVRRVAEEAGAELEGENSLGKLRRVCYAMMDAFDHLCGDGTAQKIFGSRVNVKAIYTGYNAFTTAVAKAEQAAAAEMGSPTPTNREQRRDIRRK